MITESVGVSLLVVMLAVHTTRGPGIVFNTFGTGEGYASGYFGAFLAMALATAYGFAPVFETARMYRGPIRRVALERVYGVTTFELGQGAPTDV